MIVGLVIGDGASDAFVGVVLVGVACRDEWPTPNKPRLTPLLVET